MTTKFYLFEPDMKRVPHRRYKTQLHEQGRQFSHAGEEHHNVVEPSAGPGDQ